MWYVQVLNKIMKRLAIIPARGSSKRIKNKNIKSFLGKPIINYTLETIIKSKLFSEIHVSTDSKKIKKICEKKVKISSNRPKHLSGDKVSIMAVVKYVLKNYENQNFDEAWLIYPCSPLIEIKDFKNISKLIKKENKTILTVAEFPAPVERFYNLDQSQKLLPNNKKNFRKNSQSFLQAYYETGSIMAIPKKNFKNISSKPNIDNLFPYILERYKSIDINTLSDWKFAELIYKSLKYIKPKIINCY